MKRIFIVTTWDSMTGETDTRTIEVIDNDPANSNVFSTTEAIHNAVCAATDEEPSDWSPIGCYFMNDGTFPLIGISVWSANDGTLSTENFRERVAPGSELEN